MFRSVFTRVKVEKFYVVGVVALLMVAGVALVWTLVQNVPALSRVEDAAPAQSLMTDVDAADVRAANTQPVAGMRDADAYSVQLDRLRWRAHRVQSMDDANAFALRLDALAREGRRAFVEARVSTSATAYVYHLDSLRRMAQRANGTSAALMDADAYSMHLDDLRRLGEAVQTVRRCRQMPMSLRIGSTISAGWSDRYGLPTDNATFDSRAFVPA